MFADAYPPVAFFFQVDVIGAPGDACDSSFQEVSGLNVELGVEEVAEGGENRFVHRLPRPAKYPHLVLKRGLVTASSFLAQWAADTLNSRLTRPIVTRDLLVTLLDPSGIPLVCWRLVNAYPVRMEIGDLNALESKIVIETLEFSYNYFERAAPLWAAI